MGNIDHLLGLAMKAGRIQSGEYCTEKSIKSGASRLVIIAEDASANTKKKFTNSGAFYHVDCIEYGTKIQLGMCIGCELRSVLSIEDDGFAKAMKKKLACPPVPAKE